MAATRKKKLAWVVGVVAAAALVSGGLSLVRDTPVAYAAAGVTGKVTYSGAVTPKKVEVTKNPEVCGLKPIPYEEIMVGAGKGLRNAVVSITAPAATVPTKDVTINQEGCVYIPHVAATTKGSNVVLTTADPILHNVHGYLDDRTLFNVGLPVKGMKVKKKIKKAGHMYLKCDAGHTWMSAHIMVFDHPYYAVTGADGSFTIPGVPAGSHDAKVWHEKLGEKTAKVTVGADGSGSVSFSY